MTPASTGESLLLKLVDLVAASISGICWADECNTCGGYRHMEAGVAAQLRDLAKEDPSFSASLLAIPPATLLSLRLWDQLAAGIRTLPPRTVRELLLGWDELLELGVPSSRRQERTPHRSAGADFVLRKRFALSLAPVSLFPPVRLPGDAYRRWFDGVTSALREVRLLADAWCAIEWPGSLRAWQPVADPLELLDYWLRLLEGRHHAESCLYEWVLTLEPKEEARRGLFVNVISRMVKSPPLEHTKQFAGWLQRVACLDPKLAGEVAPPDSGT